MPQICQHGFDERLTNLYGLYGAGSYLASEGWKAMQYCARPLMTYTPWESGREYVITFCRVLLGAPHYTEEVMQSPDGSSHTS